jgi:hypothetical protein
MLPLICTLFARQANITSGPQQVNNGDVVNSSPTRAGIPEGAPNKLLEAHGERLDLEATRTAGQRDQELAPVGALDGTADAGRQGLGIPQRIPRRRASEVPGTRKRTQRGHADSA